MKQLPTAAEVREVLRQMGSMNIWTHDIHVMKNAQLALLQFAEMLERVERGELATVKYAGRAKFEPCCDGTDYRCSICGGIVRYDGTPPEAE